MAKKYTSRPANYSNSIVGFSLTYMGKPTTPKKLIALGYSQEEIDRVMSKKPKANHDYIERGLVMQYFYSGWHGFNVVVKANERFAWLKSFEDLEDDSKKPVRYLKRELAEQGFSLNHCGYPSGPESGSEYLGKVINLDA